MIKHEEAGDTEKEETHHHHNLNNQHQQEVEINKKSSFNYNQELNNNSSNNEKSDAVNSSNDGFILVKSKKKINSNHKHLGNQAKPQLSQTSNENVDKDALELSKKLELIKQKLIDYDNLFYWSKLKLILNKILDQHSTRQIRIINVICYGLGSLDDNLSSRHQFALFLLILDNIKACFRQAELNVELFDPVFNDLDKYILTNVYKFKLEASNTKCMRHIGEQDDELCLFYMPHCGKALVNNLLYSNWSFKSLNKIILLGNSLSNMQVNILDSIMSKHYSYIRDASLYLCKEIELNSSCDLTNSFYGFSFHFFELDSAGLNELNSKLSNKISLNLDIHNLNMPYYENELDDELY